MSSKFPGLSSSTMNYRVELVTFLKTWKAKEPTEVSQLLNLLFPCTFLASSSMTATASI